MVFSDRGSIRSVDKTEPSGLKIVWADGHVSDFPSIWLMAACACDRCGSTESALRHVRLTDVPEDPAIVSAHIERPGSLVVDWGAGHRSRFALTWLRGHCLSDQERARRRHRPTIWSSDIRSRLPYFSYPSVAGDPAQHLHLLETVRDFGFAILRQVPPERERTEEIASLVGKLRMTNYGIFELRSKSNPEILGETAMAQAPHTDEPYRRDPPGITFFHVISQSEVGGDSTLVDGFNIAAILRRRDAETFQILVQTPALFHRTLLEGRAFAAEAPIISLDATGEVCGIRLLDRGLAPVDLPAGEVRRFYGAVRKLLELIYCGEGLITVKLMPGEMLVFNNQRLLHGRTAFDPSRSVRHVRSCHVDLDEFYSRLRVLYRNAGREEAWMKFSRATSC